MKKYLNKKVFVGFTIFIALVLVAFSGSHPVTGTGGYTGAPGDSACTQCHSPGGSLDGTMLIEGLPATVDPNTTYPLTVTITDTSPGGTAVRSGFQIVSLKQNLANGGTFAVAGSETNASIKMIAGKSYVGHQPAKNFDSNDETVYQVEWTSPASATGPITLYGASIIANGSNGNSNDKFVTNQAVTEITSGGTPLTVTFSNVVDAQCSSSANGSATANPAGGTGGYSYAWDNGETNQTAVALSPGDHDVTVTDNSSTAVVGTVTIEAPLPIDVFSTNVSDATCNGTNTGSATIVASGGVGGFDFDWGSGISGDVQNSLFAGNYVVTVTDNNDCTITINVDIGEPDPLNIAIVSLQEPSCQGSSDGSVEVAATGGNGDFTYTWLPAIGTVNDEILSDIPAGTYTVEVIDSEGCTSSSQVTLGEPALLEVEASNTDVSCVAGMDGTATVSVFGGTPDYTFAWSNGATTQSIDGLETGSYSVTVTDSNGCTLEESVSVSEPISAVTAGISITQQSNCGNSDGILSAFGDGGTAGYTYEWSTGANSAVLDGVPSGTYSVTVSDQLGCTATTEEVLTDSEGVSLAANNVTNVTCNGGGDGSATISASSTAGGFTYMWSNGGDQETEENLAAGTYSITVEDASGCMGEITIEIVEPDAIILDSILVVDISCNGLEDGFIYIEGVGGTGDLFYQWNIGSDQTSVDQLVPGAYDVTITDQAECSTVFDFVIEEPSAIEIVSENVTLPSCNGEEDGSITVSVEGGTSPYQYNWSNGSSIDTIADLSSGDYSVTVTDANGCTEIFNYTIDDPAEVFVMVNGVDPLCAESSDGSLSLTIEGGTSPYAVLWDDGSTNSDRDSVSAGSYEVTVTDSNGCSTSLVYDLMGPPAIEPNVTTTDETSNGSADGTAMSDPIFGLEPYSYLWSNGESSNMITGLASGMYSVTVTDSDGCTGFEEFVINNGDCDLVASTTIMDVTCNGDSDGEIMIVVEGAVDPVSYSWSNGATTTSLDSLAPGTYSVSITDANNCQLQVTDMEILDPDVIEVTDFEIVNPTSDVSTDGEIKLTVVGGTGDYSYELADDAQMGLGIARLDSLGEGSYFVIITDENGCQVTVGPYGLISPLSTGDFESEILVYPNPVRQQLFVDTDGIITSSPILMRSNGQRVNAKFSKVNSVLVINTDHLTSGIYILRLSIDKHIILKKVVVL